MKKIILFALLLLTFRNASSQVKIAPPCKYFFRLKWDIVEMLRGVAGYWVYFGNHSNVYQDSIFAICPYPADSLQIGIEDQHVLDSIFIRIAAVDSNANKSTMSNEVQFVPDIAIRDIAGDSIVDARDILKLRKYHGRTAWKRKD